MNDAALMERPMAMNAPDIGGDVTVMAREQSETLVLYSLAQRFKRDVLQARSDIQNAFSRPRLAEVAQYEYAKGGTEVRGASIRAAEALAQCWGNIGHGWRIASESTGTDGVPVSKVEVWAVDYQSRNRSEVAFYVRHWRSVKGGGYALKDDREVYELVANMAARRKRACILAVIPGDVVDDALDQAAATLAARADTSAEAMSKMVDAFAQWGVTRAHIEKFIQRNLDSIAPAQVVTLKRIFVSLRDGMSVAGRWFDMGAEGSDGAGAGGSLAAVKGALSGAGGAMPPPANPLPPAPPAPSVQRVPRAARRRPDDPPPPPADESAAPSLANVAPDVAAVLAGIRAATDLRDLDGMDETIASFPPADRALLAEACLQRERVLAAELNARAKGLHNEEE